MVKLIDVSEELIVRRCAKGIYLDYPPKRSTDTQDLRVMDILKCNMNSFFVDIDSNIQNINNETLLTCGFPSLRKTIGKNIYVAADRKTGDVSIKHDQKVLKTKEIVILEEDFHRFDETNFMALTIKLPWYDCERKLIGVMGFSITSIQHSMPDSLNFLIKNKFFSSPNEDLQTMFHGRKLCGVTITKREQDCLQLLMRGMSAKIIAKKLNISPRTVEGYIDNIKVKFNVNTKSELIDKIIASE